MNKNHNKNRNKNYILLITSMAIALGISAFLSPLASKDPDGLDRVAQDLKFEDKANTESVKKLPFAQIFEEYSIKSIENEQLSTAIAGVTGTLVVFGITYGIGKLVTRKAPKQ